MHGGGRQEQQNLPKNLVEIFCAELLCKVQENGKLEQLTEFINICKTKGPSFCSQSSPVSKAPNLLEGLNFYITGSHPTFEFGEDNEVTMKEVLEHHGGFVRDSETKQVIKEYLKNVKPTFIVVPKKLSTTKSVPKAMNKFIGLSATNNWPLITNELIEDICMGILSKCQKLHLETRKGEKEGDLP